MAAAFILPQEILVKVFDHVPIKALSSIRLVCAIFETASNPRFARELLSRRCHTMSSQSISTMDEIAQHSYFGSFVDTLIFNCVRTADRHSSTKGDNLVTGLPFQIDPKETIEENSAKYAKIVRAVRTVNQNHGKINIGVVFEDVRLPQSCFGLKKLLSTTGDSTAKRTVYSPAHLKNNLKALMRICKQVGCPINRVELDLGGHTSECGDREHLIFGCRTLYSDLKEIYAGSITPSVSLDIKTGSGRFTIMSSVYDHVSRSFRKSCKPMRADFSCRHSMGYLSAAPEWLATTPVIELELVGSSVESIASYGSVYLRQWSSQLEKLTLRNLCNKHDWSSFMTWISTLPALKKVCFSQLSSYESILTQDRKLCVANFLDIVLWQAEGPNLKEKLFDLATRLHAEETAWYSLPNDPSKYTNGLGAKIVNEEKKSSNNGAPEAGKCTKEKKTVTSGNKTTCGGPSYYAIGVEGAKRRRLSTEKDISKATTVLKAADLARNHPPTFRVTAAHGTHNVKGWKNHKLDRISNVCYFTARRPAAHISSLETSLQKLSLTPENPLSEIKSSRVVKLKIPNRLCKDGLDIVNPGKDCSTASDKEHSKRTPEAAGVTVLSDKIADHTSRQSATTIELALGIRRHSGLLDSVLNTLSNATTHFVTNTTQRYVLEEVSDSGDIKDWADDLCDSINKISLRKEQIKPTTTVQLGKVTFKGAFHTEMDQNDDDWAEEIGWDLDQVLKKHREKA